MSRTQLLNETQMKGLLKVGDAQRVPAPHFAIIRLGDARDHPKQRRFAGAVSSHQADPLALLDLEIDMREQRMMAIGQRDVSKSQEGHVCGAAYCGAPIVPRHAARVMHATDYRRYCSRNSQITRLASKSCVVRPIRNSGRYWTPRGQV